MALTGLITVGTSLMLMLVRVLMVAPGFMAALDGGTLSSYLAAIAISEVPAHTWLVLGVISGLLTLVGGMRLRALRSPSLVLGGAVLAMIPCCSPCCPLGVVTGGWALFVMRGNAVRAAMVDA